jgi:hypothetical protein
LAAVWPQILDKSGQKPAEKIFHEKYEFSLDLLAFVSNCHQNFFLYNISRHDIFILILSFTAAKHIFEKTQNLFLISPNFFPKFADNLCWDLATLALCRVATLRYVA